MNLTRQMHSDCRGARLVARRHAVRCGGHWIFWSFRIIRSISVVTIATAKDPVDDNEVGRQWQTFIDMVTWYP